MRVRAQYSQGAIMKSHSIERAWCKGCGICVAFCPKKALSIDLISQKAVWDEEKCIYCGLCEHYCPDLAITVINEKTGCAGTKSEEAANG